LAFWDKTDKTNTLVVATHGIIKKTDKMPKTEIEKAKAIMKQYFNFREARIEENK
jgi:phage-related protein